MTSKISLRVLKTALLSLLAACSQSAPETIARLEIDPAGTFSLNGRPVSENRLVEELQALRQTSENLTLEIWVPQNANHEVVSKAVVSAQSAKIAGIRFGGSPAK